MTLEDKLLGEKLHYYCSSSESSEDEDEDSPNGQENNVGPQNATGPSELPAFKGRAGSAVNTGPKGVLKDWQRFKQLENEKREAQEREKLELIKKLSLTCQSQLDEKKESQEELDPDLKDLFEDDFLKEYMEKRMIEMYSRAQTLPTFGELTSLKNGQEFLDAVDGLSKDVVILVHLYEEGIPSCDAMNGCLACLAEDYRRVKFCKLKASMAGVSNHFKTAGVPAILAYKNGQMLGNFVRLQDEFGEDFFASDVELFLIEHGILRDKSLIPSIIRESIHGDDLNDD